MRIYLSIDILYGFTDACAQALDALMSAFLSASTKTPRKQTLHHTAGMATRCIRWPKFSKLLRSSGTSLLARRMNEVNTFVPLTGRTPCNVECGADIYLI